MEKNSGSALRFRLALASVCTGGALFLGWMVWQPPRAATVSLDLVQYKRWPAAGMPYAELRLSNNTGGIIQYPVVRDSVRQVPILCRKKVSDGWTKDKVDEESKGLIFSYHDLKPGQNVTFTIPIHPGAPAKQVGVICKIPETRAKNKFRDAVKAWSIRAKAALKIKTLHRPRGHVWCPDVLVLPDSESATR
jgi:hypothetical protein